ncbi:MAG: FAD:protein FMN transferase [Bacillus subtilis]|nr:FAD:protein FMN transferase [Bacillus subtilis]
MSSAILACDPKTTTFPNPNDDYCAPSSNPNYYKCDIAWTSYFDTKIALTLYAGNGDDVDAIFASVTDLLQEYHALFDKYNAYEGVVGIYAINAGADTQTSTTPLRYGETMISSALFDAIRFALDHEDEVKSGSVSLFNIALGPVLEKWHDLREQDACDEFIRFGSSVCPIPAPTLFEQSFAIDPADIVLDEVASTIGFRVPGMRLDLGGFGKGYVAELITDYLDGIQARYIFNAGASNVKAGGVNPNSTDGFYNVALTTPTIGLSTGSNFFAIVKIGADVSIVTSGTYQRYFIGLEDDRIYHHLIDPQNLLSRRRHDVGFRFVRRWRTCRYLLDRGVLARVGGWNGFRQPDRGSGSDLVLGRWVDPSFRWTGTRRLHVQFDELSLVYDKIEMRVRLDSHRFLFVSMRDRAIGVQKHRPFFATSPVNTPAGIAVNSIYGII